MRLELKLQQQCDACGIPLDDSSTKIDVSLYGAEKYCYCPACGSDTTDMKDDLGWQQMFEDIFLDKLTEELINDHYKKERQKNLGI